MGIEDAIRVAEFAQASKVIGVHYDTFGYIKIDHQYAIAAFKAKNIDLTLLEIGGSLML
jgi:L-ascorbate metabolism protein UlaG (beta-lactamase superfamily)